MPLVEHDDVVEALTPDRADHPFDERILPGREVSADALALVSNGPFVSVLSAHFTNSISPGRQVWSNHGRSGTKRRRHTK